MSDIRIDAPRVADLLANLCDREDDPFGAMTDLAQTLERELREAKQQSKSVGEFRRIPGAWVVFEEAAEPGEAPSQGFYIDPQRAEHFAGERGFCKNHLAEVYIREPHKPVGGQYALPPAQTEVVKLSVTAMMPIAQPQSSGRNSK